MEEEQDIDKKESLYKITYSSQFKKDYKKFENNKKKNRGERCLLAGENKD